MADMKKNEGQQGQQGQQGQGQQPQGGQGQQGQQGQNVPVRQQREAAQPARQQQQRTEYRSPLQLMRELLRDPFGMMAPMMNDLSVAMEVRETKDAFVFEADLPGVGADDIEIQLHGNRLTISGKREQEMENRDDRYYAYERSYGTFQRVFTLPEQADTEHIRSQLDNGVLTLVIPKKPGAQPRKIQIGSGQQQKS
jgi:HSP20 family protein